MEAQQALAILSGALIGRNKEDGLWNTRWMQRHFEGTKKIQHFQILRSAGTAQAQDLEGRSFTSR
jgi:hypothetical protein